MNRINAFAVAFAAVALTLAHTQANAQDTIAQTQAELPVIKTGDIVVTGTREKRDRNDSPESVGKIGREELQKIAPTHPAEALNRIAGVHVNNLGGEGHMTAIRQPITTSGVYLFLEDGLPTRPAGFFNHNALYEINIPQSDSLEVTKGPGSALYGSEAIGGIINSVTQPSPEDFSFSFNPEIGSYGWKRGLLSIGDFSEDLQTGARLNVNVTDNEGYQEDGGYQRESFTLRTDSFFSDVLSMKNIFSYTQVDQSGVSGLNLNDFVNNPRKNYYHGDIGKREVEALRVSSEINYEPDRYNLFTITPFFRDNTMTLMPSWQLGYQPEIYEIAFQSYGVQSKYRRNIPSIKAQVIVGTDVDYTPSTFIADDIIATPDADGIYRNYTQNGRVYDFTADQLAISPYLHGEIKPVKDLTLSAGLRYDYFAIDYKDQLPASVSEFQFNPGLGRPVTRFRPDSQKVSYDQLSPKFGAVYDFNENYNAYFNYRRSFRVPSATTMFAPGSSSPDDQLEPTIADSFEIGTRGQVASWLNYDVALFHMIVSDDVVSYFDGPVRKRQNAGKTTHQGIEIAANGKIADEWNYRAAFTYTKQEYDDFSYTCGGFGAPQTCNRAGFTVARAPETIANLAIGYSPSYVPGLFLEAEYVHIGPYFSDDTNTFEYEGYNLLNARAEYDVSDNLALYIRGVNLTDERYSVLTSNAPAVEYRPGLPLSFFGGIRVKFGQ